MAKKKPDTLNDTLEKLRKMTGSPKPSEKPKEKPTVKMVKIEASTPEEAMRKIRETIEADKKPRSAKDQAKLDKELERAESTLREAMGGSSKKKEASGNDDYFNLVPRRKLEQVRKNVPEFTGELSEFCADMVFHMCEGDLEQAQKAALSVVAGAVLAVGALGDSVNGTEPDRKKAAGFLERMIRTMNFDPKKEKLYRYETDDRTYFLFVDKNKPFDAIDKAIADSTKQNDMQSVSELRKIRDQYSKGGKDKGMH